MERNATVPRIIENKEVTLYNYHIKTYSFRLRTWNVRITSWALLDASNLTFKACNEEYAGKEYNPNEHEGHSTCCRHFVRMEDFLNFKQ